MPIDAADSRLLIHIKLNRHIRNRLTLDWRDRMVVLKKLLVNLVLVFRILLLWVPLHSSPAVEESNQPTPSSTNTPCVISDAAAGAIAEANEAWKKMVEGDAVPEGSPEVLDLIFKAEAAARPPECNSGRAKMLADRAIAIARRTDPESIRAGIQASAGSSYVPDIHTNPWSPVLGLKLSFLSFDDETFAGTGRLWGYTLGVAYKSRYEIGYTSINNSLPWGGYAAPSLSDGPELASNEDLKISADMFYLAGNFPITGKWSGFGLIGHSTIAIKSNLEQPCFFTCGEFVSLINRTDYRHEESGLAWGVGIRRKNGPYSAFTLTYIDQSVDDFELSGIYVGISLQE